MKTRRGVISTIVLIIIALIILGYYHISFKSIAQSPIVQDNLRYAWQLFIAGIKYGWQFLLDTMQHIAASLSKS